MGENSAANSKSSAQAQLGKWAWEVRRKPWQVPIIALIEPPKKADYWYIVQCQRVSETIFVWSTLGLGKGDRDLCVRLPPLHACLKELFSVQG